MVQIPNLKYSKKVNILGIGGGVCSGIMWNSDSVFQAEILITITMHNNSNSIKVALKSALSQQGNLNYAILIINDSSEDDWINVLGEQLFNGKVFIAQCCTKKTWKSRNLALKIARTLFTEYKWMCRLDADDEFASKHVLIDVVSNILKLDPPPVWVLSGNYLRIDGKIIERVNFPNKELKKSDILLEQLFRLKNLDMTAELPSCNLWIHRDISVSYPEIESAEDHWLVAKILIEYPDQGLILPEIVHTIYSLSGITTENNRKSGDYFTSRYLLYQSAYYWIHQKLPSEKSLICLGWGGEGMVWLEDGIAKKKFYPNIDFSLKKEWLEQYLIGKHIVSAKWIKKKDRWEAHYIYDITKPCKYATPVALSNFIQFMLKSNIALVNIARKNIRMKNNELIFIDIGQHIYPFEIRYFRDICARLYLLFIQKYSDILLSKITGNIRNNVEELKKIPGFEDFFRREMNLFFTSQGFLAKPFRNITKRRTHKEITLLIKSCAMEYEQLEQSIYHINHQLCSGDQFAEKILLIDSREEDFLRQYSSGNLSDVIKIAEKLKNQKIIDNYLISPTAKKKELISHLNKRWFNLDCRETHTFKSIPVFSHLWGFEQIKTRFVLQMDSDVIIYRKDSSYDVIGDMLKAIRKKNVFSVGFNICQSENASFKAYDAPSGKYVPEVRFGLLDLERMKQERTYPNFLIEGKLGLSWYRSIEKFQKTNDWGSLRGGNPNIFYIHPPNSYKSNIPFLRKVVDLVEQGYYPRIQQLQWDLTGNENHWKYPCRKEKIIILILIKDDNIHWGRACIRSVTSQSDSNWGLLLINTSSSLEFRYWLQDFIETIRDKTTLVNNYECVDFKSYMQEIISEVCVNENSLVIGLRSDETFFHPYVIQRILDKLTDKTQLIVVGIYYDYHPLIGFDVEESDRSCLDSLKKFLNLNCIRGSSLKNIDYVINSLIPKPIINQIEIQFTLEEIILIPEYCIFHPKLEYSLEGKLNQFDVLNRKSIYIPNMKRLEIDITYECNLRCNGCCRSCAQAPEKLHMDIETIKKFLQETETLGIQWESVHILGGEPTLHPQFQEIMALLDEWFKERSPSTDLKVISNGHGDKVRTELEKIPKYWLYNTSFKESLNTDYFEPFNLAPIDLPGWENEDFQKGCWITQDSGIGLTPFGYFHCAIAGGIERIMKLGKGFYKIPQHPWEFLTLMRTYCQYCGHFLNDHFHSREEQLKVKNTPDMMSKTWKNSYEKWKLDALRK